MNSVCGEKKSRSFEFLKLMGATDGEILFGHFLNHFLTWQLSYAVCIIYFIQFIPSKALPFNALLILVIIGWLFMIHFICFLFLLSAPFERYSFAELLLLISIFTSASIITNYPNGFLRFILNAHPYAALDKFSKICTESLVYEFDFKDSLAKILNFSSSEHMSLLNLFLTIIMFTIIILAFTNYVIQVNPLQRTIAKPFDYFLKSAYWCKTSSVTNYIPPERREFEEVSSDKRPAIILKDVNKSYRSWFAFGRFQVLKKYNFAIYEKQITVLLGHNVSSQNLSYIVIQFNNLFFVHSFFAIREQVKPQQWISSLVYHVQTRVQLRLKEYLLAHLQLDIRRH